MLKKFTLEWQQNLLQGLVNYFEYFRHREGLTTATLIASEMSEALNTEPSFQKITQRKSKRLFEYS